MKKIFLSLCLSGCCCFTLLCDAAVTTALVQGDHVNLRARPDLNSEVVGQVNAPQELEIKSLQEEWVEVVPPPAIGLWVHRDFVEDNRVAVARLNVRSGPGINFQIVDRLERGILLDVRKTFTEWLKIAPPASASLWVNRTLVSVDPSVRTLQPEHAADTSSSALGQAAEPPPMMVRRIDSPNPVAPPPPGTLAFPSRTAGSTPARQGIQSLTTDLPEDWELIPLKGQAVNVERSGELAKTGLWFGKPTSFRLINRRDGRLDMICYVHGNREQMRRFEGQQITLRGRQYWIRGVREPIMLVEEIIPIALDEDSIH